MPTQKPRTTIYLEPELFQALDERAKEEKRTISNLCNLLIEQAMKTWLDQRSQAPSNTQPPPPTASKTKAQANGNSKGRGKRSQSPPAPTQNL